LHIFPRKATLSTPLEVILGISRFFFDNFQYFHPFLFTYQTCDELALPQIKSIIKEYIPYKLWEKTIVIEYKKEKELVKNWRKKTDIKAEELRGCYSF